MKRLFWVALGATAGVLVVRALTRAAGNLTPDGAADRMSTAVGGLSQAVREFGADVKIAMAERETELREALGIAEDGTGVGDPAAVEHLFSTDHPRGTF
jgi:hypothetical protein